jgi:alpha-L-fucosidase
MKRREFCELVGLGAGAAVIPLSAKAKNLQQVISGGVVQSFPVSEWQSVVDNPWGAAEASEGPGTWDGVSLKSPAIPALAGEGPFTPDWKSLLEYEAPEWYRDAKFGIWAHWSPQCVPEAGDWYARNMYIQGQGQYDYHVAHYGHPSKFGYKDLCAQWTLLNWEPEAMMERFKKAGAKLFVALANHHDGFDAWDSKHHSWNARKMGPKRDVIGEWAAAARREGLQFGVTVHAARNWWWFQSAHLCDTSGPLKGVPYDGQLTQELGKDQWWGGFDPQELYGRIHGIKENPDEKYLRNFYDRVRDLIEQHDPDLLYFDNGGLPLGWAGMNIGAYFYNHYLKTHDGQLDAVLNIKQVPEELAKAVVADYERGVTDSIMPHAWQSETCIGEWHYNRSLLTNHKYMKPVEAIRWMVDAVSKNGTFILNIPGKPDGTIDSDEVAILEAIGSWMQTNGEAIYSTRPWKTFGEGPHAAKSGSFSGASTASLDSSDIRFTRNKRGDVVYAIVLGWPAEEKFQIKSLGTASPLLPGKVANAALLGYAGTLQWNQSAESLTVEKPSAKPCDFAYTLKIEFA